MSHERIYSAGNSTFLSAEIDWRWLLLIGPTDIFEQPVGANDNAGPVWRRGERVRVVARYAVAVGKPGTVEFDMHTADSVCVVALDSGKRGAFAGYEVEAE